MNFRKFFTGFVTSAVAVSAMAASAFADEVKWQDHGDIQGEAAIDLILDIGSNDGNVAALLPEDVVTVEITSDVADTSFWMVSIIGFSEDDEGYEGVYGKLGELTVSATVQDIMDANGFAYEDLYGICAYIVGPSDDDTYTINASVTSKETVADNSGNNSQPANGTGDTNGASVPDKGNADTGIEGVAMAAGVAIVAVCAIVVTRKRK